MRKVAIVAAFASILLASVMVAPSLYAEPGHDSSGSMMSHGMMGDNGTRNDKGMMGDMIGMMKMMKQMTQMMDHCNNMMSDSRPNDRWRKNAPSEPEKKG